jgi:periplasmic protein TonB
MCTDFESGPSARQPLGTFACAIMVETTGQPARRAIDCAIAVAIHFLIICAVAILPFFFLEDLHAYTFTRTTLITSVPPPSFGEPQSRPRAGRPPSASRFRLGSLSAPILGARRQLAETVEPAPPPEAIPWGVTGGIENLFEYDATDSPAISPVPPPPSQFLRVGDVQKARLVHGMSLPYPELARQWRIFGKVVVEAVIDPSGKVRKAHAVSGPGLLAGAAVEAVSRERFQPMLMNGVPMPCDLIVEVSFHLFD